MTRWIMQQDVGGVERHSVAQQADKRVNPHSVNTSASNSNNWDLTFLHTDHPTSVDKEPDSIGLLSPFDSNSLHGSGCVHSYQNVDIICNKNVNIHSYQNTDCVNQNVDKNRSRVSIGIPDGTCHLPEKDALSLVLSPTSHPSCLAVSTNCGINIQLSPNDVEAVKLRNSLSTVVWKAHPRQSLGSFSPPCSPKTLTRNPRTIVTKSPHSNISDASRFLSILKSPRNGAHNRAATLHDCNPVSSITDRSRKSVSSHSPNFLYENIDSEFFKDLEVFDDAQSPRMMTSHDQGLPVLFEQPQLWQAVYDFSPLWLSSVADARSKERKGLSSQENIYSHSRKPSSADGSGCCTDSGVSSASSDVLSSRHSPNSLSSELQLDQFSDTGHRDLDITDALDETESQSMNNCRMDCFSQTSSNGGSGPVIETFRFASPSPVLPLRIYPTSDVSADSDEFKHLELIRDRLMVCRFYVGRMSADEAQVRLAATPVGTYLLRDSSDHRFKYSISVQTSRGPTSIRVGYVSRRFYLDSKPEQMDSIPRFDCVLALIQFYARLNTPGRSRARSDETVMASEHRNGPVILLKPYEQRGCASLLHLCRKVINRHLDGRSTTRLCLIPSLKGYLNVYPYDF